MSDGLVTGIVSVGLAIVGLATVATIFGQNAKTTQVVQAGGNALGQDILAAVSPVTGQAPSFSSQLG